MKTLFETTCFAAHNGKCIALKTGDCYNCPFYKTKEQNKKEQEKCRKRLKKIACG